MTKHVLVRRSPAEHRRAFWMMCGQCSTVCTVLVEGSTVPEAPSYCTVLPVLCQGLLRPSRRHIIRRAYGRRSAARSALITSAGCLVLSLIRQRPHLCFVHCTTVYHCRRTKHSIQGPESRDPRDIPQVLQIDHGRRDRKGRGICCRQGCPHADIQGK